MTLPRLSLLILLPLVIAVPGFAQDALFSDDFEWGDTGDWSASEPPRCDRVDVFGRGLAPITEIHVATWGDDTSGDGSPANPYATIARAASDAVPGSAIMVHEGTYSGGIYLSDLTGTAGAPIWIGGAPGENQPVIDGGGEGLHLTRAKYLVVHDLEVRNAADNGINSDDGGDYGDPLATHHVTFKGLWIHDIGSGGNQDCLKLSGLDDYAVVLSEFSNCGGGTSGSGVDHVGCHQGLLARNTFHDLSANAIQSKGGSEDIEIRWNRFTDSGARSLNIGPNTAPETFTFASNLWYAWDNPAQSQPTLPVVETNGIYGEDPQLGLGYRIGPSSPAAGSGEPTQWTSGATWTDSVTRSLRAGEPSRCGEWSTPPAAVSAAGWGADL